MEWNIVADSSCELYKLDWKQEEIGFSVIPFTIEIDGIEYEDNEKLDISHMVDHMELYKKESHTACPNTAAWYEEFKKADKIIAVTISSQLSGSYNSALAAKEMILEEYPDKKIHLLDSKAAGSELAMIIYRITQSIDRKMSFEEVVTDAEQFAEKTHVLFVLLSFDNLVKNGRMNRLVGIVADKLNMCAIGIGCDEGKISIQHKVRGKGKISGILVQDMKEKGYTGGTVIISHCMGQQLALKVAGYIRQVWEDVKIDIIPTRGLCSYYVERGGIIIGF